MQRTNKLRNGMITGLIAALLTLGACGNESNTDSSSGNLGAAGSTPTLVSDGTYGGEHGLLTVSGSEITYVYGCITGTISGPIHLNSGGTFEASGSIRRGIVPVKREPGPPSRRPSGTHLSFLFIPEAAADVIFPPTDPSPRPPGTGSPRPPGAVSPPPPSPLPPSASEAFPAKYIGSFDGDTLTLEVYYDDGAGKPQHFTDSLKLNQKAGTHPTC